MKKVFLKLLLFACLLIIIKLVVNVLMPPYNLKKIIVAKNAQITKLQPDLFFIGSSRLKTGIVPKIINKICVEQQLTSYNLSLDHFTFPYTSAWIKEHLEEHPSIKTIVVEVSFLGKKIIDFEHWWSFSYRGVQLSQNNELKLKMLNSLGKLLDHDIISPLDNLNVFINPGVAEKNTRDGYSPYPKEKTHHFNKINLARIDRLTHAALQPNPDPFQSVSEKIYTLTVDEIQTICSRLGIQLIFIAPPFLMNQAGVDNYHFMAKYLQQKGIPLIYNQDENLYLPKYRYDGNHLNKAGARLFSREIGRQLMTIISDCEF